MIGDVFPYPALRTNGTVVGSAVLRLLMPDFWSSRRDTAVSVSLSSRTSHQGSVIRKQESGTWCDASVPLPVSWWLIP